MLLFNNLGSNFANRHKLYILFSLHFRKQTMPLLVKTMSILLLVAPYTTAYYTSICIQACKSSFFIANVWVCKKCAKDPPITAAFCKFACTKSEINPWPLTDICERCFNDRRRMMKYVCKDQCISKASYTTGILCETCDLNKFETCASWPVERRCTISS